MLVLERLVVVDGKLGTKKTSGSMRLDDVLKI